MDCPIIKTVRGRILIHLKYGSRCTSLNIALKNATGKFAKLQLRSFHQDHEHFYRDAVTHQATKALSCLPASRGENFRLANDAVTLTMSWLKLRQNNTETDAISGYSLPQNEGANTWKLDLEEVVLVGEITDDERAVSTSEPINLKADDPYYTRTVSTAGRNNSVRW